MYVCEREWEGGREQGKESEREEEEKMGRLIIKLTWKCKGPKTLRQQS